MNGFGQGPRLPLRYRLRALGSRLGRLRVIRRALSNGLGPARPGGSCGRCHWTEQPGDSPQSLHHVRKVASTTLKGSALPRLPPQTPASNPPLGTDPVPPRSEPGGAARGGPQGDVPTRHGETGPGGAPGLPVWVPGSRRPCDLSTVQGQNSSRTGLSSVSAPRVSPESPVTPAGSPAEHRCSSARTWVWPDPKTCISNGVPVTPGMAPWPGTRH